MMDEQIEQKIDAQINELHTLLKTARTAAGKGMVEVKRNTGVATDTISRFERNADFKTLREVMRLVADYTGKVPDMVEAVKATIEPDAPERPAPAPP